MGKASDQHTALGRASGAVTLLKSIEQATARIDQLEIAINAQAEQQELARRGKSGLSHTRGAGCPISKASTEVTKGIDPRVGRATAAH